MIPIDILIKTKSAEEVADGKAGSVERSLRYIVDMENGVPGAKKRNPITVHDNGDGTYNVIDGNATHEAATRLAGISYPPRLFRPLCRIPK